MGGEGRRDEGKRGDTFLPYHRLLKTQCLIFSWYMKLYIPIHNNFIQL